MNATHTTRRRFMQAMGASAASLACPGTSPSAHAAKQRPNVLIVLTDDQGWGDIQSHGNDILETPVLDRLAASGARFERFYVSPVCAPTRASLLTGRYHLRTGVTGVTHRKETMRSSERTLAEIMGDAGYATGCFGKWHNGAHYPNHPNGQGFDEFFGFCAGHWNNYFDTTLERNGEPARTEGYINDVLTDAACDFMGRHRAEPFLCYVPYNTPHTPFQVPDKYFDEFKQRGLDDSLACIYGMCKSLDDCMGRLLDKLDELGIAENTIVLFFGDNGPNTDRFNGNMRGRKGSVYEGGVRNSMFIRWPKGIRPGTTIEPISAHIDLLPTLLDLAGIPLPAGLELDGRSVAPLLRGESSPWPDRRLFFHWGGRGAVRTQQYRLARDRGKTRLFDLTQDPGEEKDLAERLPEVTQDLTKAYDAWYADVTKNGTEPPPSPVGHPGWDRVELPAPECIREGVDFKGGKGWANDYLAGWDNTDAHVYWEIDIVRQGRYEVTLMYACPEEDVGATVCAEAAGQRLQGRLEKAHNPDPIPSPDRVARKEVYEKTWAPLNLGAMDLPEGSTRLYIRALDKPGNTVMELKSVVLEEQDQ